MTARKYSASMDEDLLDEVRAAAEDDEKTLSAWLADVARERVRLLALGRLLDEWEAENGAFTEEELAAADEWLNNPMTPDEALREYEAREAAKKRKKRKSA